MQRLTRWVLKHRFTVVVIWLGVAVVGGVLAPTTVERLTYNFELPGQAAYEANQRIVSQWGGGGTNPPLLVVLGGSEAKTKAVDLASVLESGIADSRTITWNDAGAGSLASPDGLTSTVVVYPPVVPGPEPYAASTVAIRDIVKNFAAEADGLSDAQVSGFTELAEGGGSDRGVLIEVLLGGVGALIVLALVFGSLLAGVPLVVAAVSILATFLSLLGLSLFTDVSFVVQYLVALIGLGVSIDYSLLLITRWREERIHHHVNNDAVLAAMLTSGRAVLWSGITVAISLAALIVVPLPFLRSIGLGGLLIPLLSVAASLTLVPALLSIAGPKLSWPKRKPVSTRSALWTRIAQAVLRHRWITIIGCGAALIAIALPAAGLTLGSPQLSGIASNSPESQAVAAAIDSGTPAGILRPTDIVVPKNAVQQSINQLHDIDGVAAVAAPDKAAWKSNDEQLLHVWLADDPASDAGRTALSAIRAANIGDVGGSPAEDADFIHAVYQHIIWVILAVILATFLLLARALRSLWLPIKALVLNVLSISAAYGATVLIWQDGIGSQLLFGQDPTGVITTWVPIAAFAFLFGLSMDYEVFILARIREAYDSHGNTERAVVDGIGYTGRLVSSAALILFLAFIALSTVPVIEVKILATTLALGIIIDATIVRGLLAPALVAALGKLNWTQPPWLTRLTTPFTNHKNT